MNLKEEILKNSGLYSIQNDDVYITEGIRFFKHSKRLRKFANKILSRMGKTKGIRLGVERKKELAELVKKIDSLATDFQKIENEFSMARANKDKAMKIAAKLKHKDLKTKHAEILKMMRKENVKTGLKIIGGIGLAVGVTLLLYHFFVANAIGTKVINMADRGVKNSGSSLNFEWLFPKNAEVMGASSESINQVLAGAGGLTAIGGLGFLGKFFGKFKSAKAYKATKRTIQELKDVEVTTAKEEKEKKANEE